ncbi:hypothetical protein [[Actinomadura] parvosata]|uniref:hypothetical protein n=1 Tax=[Actinomadura] parvosata TaxID=1955412 RepID=UPI0012BC3090|nr:hypothetical protein [Nonomuraea sp. ATCC 55076]
MLDELAPALNVTPGLQIVDYRDGDRRRPRIHAIASAMPATAVAYVNGGSVTQLDVTPMIFGIAWKILDLVADEILGHKASGDPHTIESKCKSARTGNGLARPRPFLNEPHLWKRYMHLYANTVDLRHSLVHRELVHHPHGRIEATSTINAPRPPTVMTRDELQYFFRAVQGLAQALIRQWISTRERDNLLFLLDQLGRHHGLGSLPGREITRSILVLARPEILPSGKLQYHAQATLTYVRSMWPTGAVDLLLQLPDGTILGGDLEDAPANDPASIRGDLPPRWLATRPAKEWAVWDAFGSR